MAVTLDSIITPPRLNFTDPNWGARGKPKDSTNNFSSDGTPYIAARLTDLYAFVLSLMDSTSTAFTEEVDYPGNSQILDALNTLVKTSIDGRNVFTTSPLLGEGPLDPDVTLSIQDGTTTQKGAVQSTNTFNGSSEVLVVTQAGVQSFYAIFQGRTISVQSPLTGGGNLSADRTIGIQDGTTSQKGAVQLTDDPTPNSTLALTPQGLQSAFDPSGPLASAFMKTDGSNADSSTGSGSTIVFADGPVLEGSPTTPAPPTNDSSNRIPNTSWVTSAINAAVGGGGISPTDFLKIISIREGNSIPTYGTTGIAGAGGGVDFVIVNGPDGPVNVTVGPVVDTNSGLHIAIIN